MAARVLLILFIHLKHSQELAIHAKLPEVTGAFNLTSHLQYAHVRARCRPAGRQRACAAAPPRRVCGARPTGGAGPAGEGGARELREFRNSCFLFFSNMCDQPENEFHIAWHSDCADYMLTRRSAPDADVTDAAADDAVTNADAVTTAPTEVDGVTDALTDLSDVTSTNTLSANRSLLRANTLSTFSTFSTFSTLYDIDAAFDSHACPHSCPDVYSPVCITVNRAFGLYYKFYTFINHCLGDQYYCKNWEEFQPPADADEEMVVSSPLSWSYCSSSKFLQFARFSEVLSSMGHYGWLAGDYKHTHIVDALQRQPDLG